MSKLKSLAAAIVVALSSQANAQVWTGNDLLTRLQSTAPGDRSSALGYIRGVADTASNDLVCPPDGVTYGQAFDVVHNWLITNASTRHNSASLITLVALGTTWPCKSSSKKGGGA